jgi:alkylhydroperoxidase family enzyme
VATLVSCSWCVDFGTTLQHLDGLDVERVQHIDEYPTHRTHPLYEPAERLVLAYADAMTSRALPATVTDAQVAELEAELGRAGLVELTHSIALENMRAPAYHALGIVDQGFDAACQVRLQG